MKRTSAKIFGAILLISLLVSGICFWSAAAGQENVAANIVGYSYQRVEKIDTTGASSVSDYLFMTGTEREAYLATTKILTVGSVDDLASLSTFINSSADDHLEGVTLVQTANIIPAATTELAPIGINVNHYFSGNYDGQGYTIDNISVMTGNSGCAGLFGRVDRGTYRNIVIGSRVEILSTGGKVGALIGNANTRSNPDNIVVDNCYVSASVAGTSFVGGIIGQFESTNQSDGSANPARAIVSNCTNAGSITAQLRVGGIVGRNASVAGIEITNCLNTGAVTSTTTAKAESDAAAGDPAGSNNVKKLGAAGILSESVGAAENTVLTKCINTGAVTSRYSAGGIVGLVVKNTGVTLNNCHNYGTVTNSAATVETDADTSFTYVYASALYGIVNSGANIVNVDDSSKDHPGEVWVPEETDPATTPPKSDEESTTASETDDTNEQTTDEATQPTPDDDNPVTPGTNVTSASTDAQTAEPDDDDSAGCKSSLIGGSVALIVSVFSGAALVVCRRNKD